MFYSASKKTASYSSKTLSYLIKCMFLMCAFLFIGIFNCTDKVEAAMKACWSGTELYVSDDGGCDNGDWNANSIKVNGNGYANAVTLSTLNGASTEYTNIYNKFIGLGFSSSTGIYMGGGYAVDMTYYEADHCTGKKKVIIYYSKSKSADSWSEKTLTGNGNEFEYYEESTLDHWYYAIAVIYGTNKCTIVNGGSESKFTGAGLLVFNDYTGSSRYKKSISSVEFSTSTSGKKTIKDYSSVYTNTTQLSYSVTLNTRDNTYSRSSSAPIVSYFLAKQVGDGDGFYSDDCWKGQQFKSQMQSVANGGAVKCGYTTKIYTDGSHDISQSNSDVFIIGSGTFNGVTGKSLEGLKQGANTYRLISVHLTGCMDFTDVYVYYDTENPTISFEFDIPTDTKRSTNIAPKDGYTWTSSPSVKVTAKDVGSRIDRYEVSGYDILDIDDDDNETTAPKTIWFRTTNPGQTYTVTITVYDKLGYSASASRSIRYDCYNPSVNSFALEDSDSTNNIGAKAGYTNNSVVNVNGQVSDSARDTGIWKYQIFEGTSVVYALSETSPETITISSVGSHTYTLCVYDYSGKSACRDSTIIYDTTAPSISGFSLIDSDENNVEVAESGYTNDLAVNVSLDASDASGIYKYKILEGASSVYDLSTTAPTSVTLANSTKGKHTLVLYVYDNAGNVITSSFDIIYDATAPTITSFVVTGNSDAQPGYTKQTNITYSITASDDSDIKYYLVKDGTETINSASTNKPTSGTLSGTNEGVHRVSLIIVDKAGNSATQTCEIVYDVTAPIISEFEAIGNANASLGYTNTTSITYNIEVNDDTSGVRYYAVKDGTTSIYDEAASAPVTDTLANTNQGTHQLTLTVTDKAGNNSTMLFLLTYDTSAPTISKFDVKGNSSATVGYTNTRNVTFEITSDFETTAQREFVVKDGNSSIAISMAESIGTPPSLPTSGTLSSTQGTHTLTLSVIDFAGNEATKTFSIILDTTAPVISSFTYSGNEGAMAGYTNQQSISYALNVTEANFKSGSVTPYNTSGTACSANAKTITSKSSSGTINLCNTTNGTHKLKVSVLDYAGNETSLNNNQIILDTVAPVLSLTTSLSPSLPAKSGTATITYTEAYPRATMTGKTLRYVLTTNSASTANIYCTAVTATTLTQTNCFGSGTLANSSTNVYTIALTLSPTTSGTYYLRVLDENLATDMAGNAVSSPVSKVSMKINNESVSTYVFGGYLIDQTAPTLSLNLGNGSYNGSGTSAIHYSKTSASITVKFTDNMYLANYSSTSAFRYCWSTTKSCSSWTAITGTRTKTEVSGTITVPSTIGTHYLIIEGATAKDYAGWYATNSYLNETRTSTSSDNRIFKFVTDNTNGSLIINYTKVSNTYYAKPNITTNIYYSDAISLRNYSGTTNYMYAWSKASTSISGWDQTYLKKMPSKSSTRISGIKTPTAEGVWYLMLYGLSTDAAGNSITAPTTYGSANVQYSDGLTQTVTAKVYRFIIDGTNPEIVLEHGENKYYGIHSDSSIGELKVGDTVKLGYVEANTRNIPANTNVKYYISSKANDLSSSISSGLVGYDDNTMVFGEEFKIMNYMSGYYIHFFVENGSSSYDLLVTDYAGNNMSKDTTRTYSGYYVVTFFITPLAASTSQLEAIDEAIIPDSSNVNGNKYLIQSRKYIILTINNQDTTRMTLSSIVSALGVRLISAYNGVGEELVTHPYLDLVIKGSSGNVYSHIAIVIFNNAPRLIISNNNPTAVVKQGEEISNVGMSFVSSDGSKVSVDTLITLDGVKVKSVDTNVPGVYNVTQVAKDGEGRTTKVNREIVVLANKEVKEEVVSEELVEEVKGIIALPIEVNVTSEQVEETTNIEVVERHIELELENKSKVKGYKKKKENKKIKKEHDNSKVLVKSREIINVRHV